MKAGETPPRTVARMLVDFAQRTSGSPGSPDARQLVMAEGGIIDPVHSWIYYSMRQSHTAFSDLDDMSTYLIICVMSERTKIVFIRLISLRPSTSL